MNIEKNQIKNAKSLEEVHTLINTNKKFNLYLISFIFFLSLILQLILTFNYSVWGDEAFSMLTVQKDWKQMWDAIISDVHPPLYYIILKIVMVITNYNFNAAKITSILPIFLMNLVVIRLTLKDKSKIHSKTTGIIISLFIVATTLTSNFLYMGQELRMYSWTLFFVTMSGIYAYKILNEKSNKNIFIFIVMGLAAALTHYFALIMEVVIYLSLFIVLMVKDRDNIRKIAVITITTILGYIFWFPIAFKQFMQVRDNFWITFSFKDILKYIKEIIYTGDDNCLIIVGIFIVALILYTLYRLIIKKDYNLEDKKKVIFGFYACLFPIIIILIGTILNICIRPIFIARYMVPSLGIFWIGIMILVYNVKHRKIMIALLAILVLFMVIVQYPNAYNMEMKTGTADTIKFVEENIKDTDLIATNFVQLDWTVFDFYFPNIDNEMVGNLKFPKKYDTIWLFSSYVVEDKTFEKLGYKLEMVYVGNIDNGYFFIVYKLNNAT